MNSSKSIVIKCQGAATQELSNLKDLQGGLKKLSKKNLEKLKRRILDSGFRFPFFIWDNGTGDLKIIDGHQRRAALLALEADGYSIPPLPVDYIHAETEQEARESLLSAASQYGEWVEDEVSEWFVEIGNDIAETIRLVDKDLLLPGKTLNDLSIDDTDNESPSSSSTCPKCGFEW